MLQLGAMTPPESVVDYQGLERVSDLCLQEMGSQPEQPQHVQQTGTLVPPGLTLSRQGDTSVVQRQQQGWHVSLQTSEHKLAHASKTATIAELEGARTSEHNGAYLAGMRYPSQETVNAEMVPSSSRTIVDDLDVLGPTHRKIPALYGLQTLVAPDESPLGRIITGYMDGARGLLADGADPIGVLGTDAVDVELFFRNRLPEDQFTVCSWASEVGVTHARF